MEGTRCAAATCAMSKVIRIQTFVVLTFLVLAGGYILGPYLRLKVEIVTHRLSYSALPVDTFTPATYIEPTVSLSLGRLNFSVPEYTVAEVREVCDITRPKSS